jgi:poly(A) polymerase Pap1
MGNGPRKLDISYPTNEFTKLVKMWDKYDADTMGVIVRYIKRYVLWIFGSRTVSAAQSRITLLSLLPAQLRATQLCPRRQRT